ncbi:MAG: polysaccharide biosynthesis protein [bacterium]|nr:polysaccharide biosynthesis protein [bacterium]
MKNSGTKNSFIVQAGILAAAGIVSRIIGLLYRSPLQRVIGDAGMGYYNIAYSFYTIILLVSSYSIPAAISKVIAQKLALREYRNAHRIFLCALGYVLVVGGAASLLLFFGAGLFVVPEAAPVLRVFAPTIFFSGILGVLRGYFQAHKSMTQTSVSQILEQIANAAVSIGAAYLLIVHSFGSLEVPADEAEQVTRATRGAIGSAMGTGAGVLAALLFMLGIYQLNRGTIHRRIQRDRHREEDSYGQILKTIFLVVTPFILSTAVYNLSTTVNTTVYTKIWPALRELDTLAISNQWGVFSGQALTISEIPIAFATAMAAAMLPTVSRLVAAKNMGEAKAEIGLAVKVTMIISIPCAVGIFVLARPLTGLLFKNTSESEDLATKLLMTLAVSVIFYALSTLSSQILQGLGKLNAPIINAGIGLAVQTAAAVLLLFFTDLEIYSIAVAKTVYAVVVCILNQASVRRAAEYRQEIGRTFLIPLLASGFMGAFVWAVYEGLLLMTKSPRIAVIPAILLGVCVYFALLLLFKGVTEEELRSFPKGYLLVKAAKRCGLLR